MVSSYRRDAATIPSARKVNVNGIERTRSLISVPDDEERPIKRRRLCPTYADENVLVPGSLLHENRSDRGKGLRKDEKALIDDLMADLDASAFENYELSPVKAPVVISASISPLKASRAVSAPSRPPVKRECLSCTPKVKANARPRTAELDVVAEPLLREESGIVAGRKEAAFDDEEEYSFDFDLTDFSAFEDDYLLKPEIVEVSSILPLA